MKRRGEACDPRRLRLGDTRILRESPRNASSSTRSNRAAHAGASRYGKGVAIAIEKGKFNIDLGLRMLRLNDSVGNMSVISPNHWRTFVFPHMKDVCTELHRYRPNVKIYSHICGNILPIVEDLVEVGLDCIGPLDPLGGFTPGEIRQRVGTPLH